VAIESTAAAVNAFLVALTGFVIAWAAYRVLQRTGNGRIWYVVAAFAILAAKNAAKGFVLLGTPTEPPWMEFAFSGVDLVVVLLIAWPIMMRRKGA
jgi:hypothetical protein